MYVGDCRDVMARMEPEQFHAVVTDPPYGLGKEPDTAEVMASWIRCGHHEVSGAGFMGKQWDAFIPQPATWSECVRTMKPGAHILCFAGTRTLDWMGMALRFVGLERRDLIMWVYGGGFPKGLDVSKAIDRSLGADREKMRTPMGKESNVWMDKIGAERPWKEAAKMVGYHEHDGDDPVTEEAKQWNGWKTSLKPAYEPIILARKSIPNTVAQCVLEHGTGAMNIDRCRIGTTGADVTRMIRSKNSSGSGVYNFNSGEVGSQSMLGGFNKTNKDGRYPSNMIHDGSDEVFDGSGSAARFFKTCSFSEEDLRWSQSEPAKDVGRCLDLQSEFVASVLTHAVERSTQRSVLQPQGVQAQSMNVSETTLRLVCESVTETIQNIERRSRLGLPQERSTAKLGPVTCVVVPTPTGTISITISLTTSSHSAEVVTFDIMLRSQDHGGLDSARPRLYYTPKADDDDRPHGSGNGAAVHPTVKPLDLMRYLVRLVCAPGGTVLDPFMGSGSTGCAALMEGMRFVGVEQSQEYADIAVGRLKLAMAGSPPMVELMVRGSEHRREGHGAPLPPKKLRG